MGSEEFSNDLWVRFIIDGQMRIMEVFNLDEKLFFGRCPVPGMTVLEAAGEENKRQVRVIMEGLQRAAGKKRNTSFDYFSEYEEEKGVYVRAHVQYRGDDTFCLYLTALDSDDLHRICEDLGQEAHNMLHAIYENLPIGLEIYDCDGRLIEINACELKNLGITDKNNVLGLNIFDNPNLPKDVAVRLRAGESVHFFQNYEFDFIRGYYETSKNIPTHLEVFITVMRDENGDIDKYLVVSRDVTEVVRKEEELVQSKRKRELAIQASNTMLWEFDVSLLLFFAENEPINNYDKAKGIDLDTYMDCVHPDDREMVLGFMRRMLQGEDFTFSFDCRMFFPGTADCQYCTVNGLPYEYNAEGRVAKFVGIRKNNTEYQKRKLLQEKILNSIPMSIHIKDVENGSRYVFCNDESKRLFGTSENKTAYDVMDAHEVARIEKTDKEVFATGNPYTSLEHIELKDGRAYDTLVLKSIIYDNDKRLLLNVRWDQSLQNDLKRRAKVLNLSMEIMNAFTWFYEPEKDKVNFGEGFDKIGSDHTRYDSIEKYVAHIHPDDRQLFRDSIQRVIQDESGEWNVEYRVDLKNDGVYTWWLTRGLSETTVWDEKPHTYMFGMSISIDKQKQNELAIMRENAKKLNALIQQNEMVLNNTNSGLAYITTDYIVQWENISTSLDCLRHEGFRKNEPCYHFYRRTSPCEDCVMRRALLSRQVEQKEYKLHNGCVVEVFGTPVVKEDGTVEGVVIRMDDVTQREHMIQELRQAKILAEQSDKLKSAFLANMSHEIRTPLNAIIGFSELLMEATAEDEREEYIKIININNELLLKLINDILDLSKIEAGVIELKYERFDFRSYFYDLVASMRQRVTRPNIQLLVNTPQEDCLIQLDKNRIAQIITNYVTNAIKYTPEGFIEMGYELEERGIRIYVKDTGIGISDEKKPKLFSRFEKLDEFAQGTGLGLSICKAIAETMGGSVGFESTHEEGSTFWAFLPCELEFQR